MILCLRFRWHVTRRIKALSRACAFHRREVRTARCFVSPDGCSIHSATSCAIVVPWAPFPFWLIPMDFLLEIAPDLAEAERVVASWPGREEQEAIMRRTLEDDVAEPRLLRPVE